MVATKTKSKKRPFLPNVRVGGRGLDVTALRSLATNEPEAFMGKVQGLIDKGELSWEKVRSVRNLFLALSDVQVPAHFDIMGEQRAIMASAFPLLAGGLTIAGINAAYDALPTIGEQLVTEIEDSKKVSVFAAIHSQDTNIDRVDEGKDFPLIGAGEKKYEIRQKRNGRRIAITAEAVEENDVAGIVGLVNQLAELASEFVEEQTLRRVCDIDGSATSPAEPYVLRPAGAGATLYSNTANTPGTQAPSGTRIHTNPLVDTTDLDAARAILAGMLNSRGKRISIPMSQCLLVVPDALVGVATKILGSEYESGVENEVSNWGPRGRWRPTLVSSPKLDDLSTTVWYLGNFPRQFKRKWKLRFEYVTLAGDTETFLKSRIAFQARIAWDVEIGATDYVFVVQNLSATTAP